MEKQRTRRSIGKVDKLPPENKVAVEQMLLDGGIPYREIVDYLKSEGHEMSQMAISNYARKFLRNVQELKIAQENFRMMMEEMDRYPDLDTTEAIARLASQNVFNAIANRSDEDWQEVDIDKLMQQANGLIRAVSHKKRVDMQNRSEYEAGFAAAKQIIFDTLAKKRPQLYAEMTQFLNEERKEGDGQ